MEERLAIYDFRFSVGLLCPCRNMWNVVSAVTGSQSQRQEFTNQVTCPSMSWRYSYIAHRSLHWLMMVGWNIQALLITSSHSFLLRLPFWTRLQTCSSSVHQANEVLNRKNSQQNLHHQALWVQEERFWHRLHQYDCYLALCLKNLS